jgi:cytoplasmic iron level regulating protein YaaA (DUF328/UPF0246 family)
MAYLITCAGSKQCPIANPSSLENLSFPELNAKRAEIIRLSGMQLDWERTLPAWKLYTGNYSKLYRQITEDNWLKPCAEIKILSALFGWIRHTDLIPYYDLKMDEMKGQMTTRAYLVWRNANILKNTVDKNNDFDLLSTLYRKAINKNGEIVAKPTGQKFTDRGAQAGNWLNRQLNLLNC